VSDFAWAGRGRDDDGLRGSLHHTARGPMPLSAWLRLPAARLRARLGHEPERPWIVPAATGWLGRRMRRDWSVLELGSGRSTAWLARRSNRVLSFEDNREWVIRTREDLEKAGIEGAEVRELPIERFIPEVAALPDRTYELVVVDFLEAPGAERVDAVRAARSKVKPGGHLLLDDSDRPAYAEAFELLYGWRERRFAGVKDGWPQAVETTIFRRPRTGM
jgi:SAM-dependent methyltransferase